jgi:hypothetical protein
MLTAKIIHKWLHIRGDGPINEHGIADWAKRDAEVAEAWEQSVLIDDLIGDAYLVKHDLASKSFADAFRQRLAEHVDGPEAEKAIWDAA